MRGTQAGMVSAVYSAVNTCHSEYASRHGRRVDQVEAREHPEEVVPGPAADARDGPRAGEGRGARDREGQRRPRREPVSGSTDLRELLQEF